MALPLWGRDHRRGTGGLLDSQDGYGMSPETSGLLSKHENKAQDKVPTGTNMSVSTSSWMQDEQNSFDNFGQLKSKEGKNV